MSKIEAQIVASLKDMLSQVPAEQNSFVVNILQFRLLYKIPAVYSSRIVDSFDDMLTWPDVQKFGVWLITEVEKPLYQFSRQAAQRLDLQSRTLVPFSSPVHLSMLNIGRERTLFDIDDIEGEKK